MVEKCRRIFGTELTGVYLHGSMAMGCFHPAVSDIDFIIVMENDITDGQKMEFMEEAVVLDGMAPAKGTEWSVVKRAYCKDFVYPTPFELHFSRTHLQWFRDNPADYIGRMRGTDRDLAAHFTVMKKYGITLYGADIGSVFGDVPEADYADSIWFDIEGAGEEIMENPMYVILNLCRAAAFFREGLVLSKKQGGEWGMRNLPSRYHAMVSLALQGYESGEGIRVDEAGARRFSDGMLEMLGKRYKDIQKIR